MKYTSAQNLFKYYAKKFKEDILLQEEFLDAINKILNLYDTRIYENRFIVGGVIEFIVLASFRALGFDATHIGKISQLLT
jgi:NAD+--asparagine ADP-ribosyltransferase